MNEASGALPHPVVTTPPPLAVRRHMSGRDVHESHRASTPLEALFDLTTVVAVAAAATRLHHGLTESSGGEAALAFVQSQAGDPHSALAASDISRSLSPCDPLLFGMLGARAMALVRLGRFEEAAEAAVEAANRPNAHPHIFAIAACTLALAGRLDEARRRAAMVLQAIPGYGVADFLRAFRFDAQGEARFREGAKRIGLD